MTLVATFGLVIANCSISGINESYTYTGSAIEPAVTVKNGVTVLASGSDYVVSYENNVNVGTATVTITGKGDYAGTVNTSFAITKAAVPITPQDEGTSAASDGSASSRAQTAKTSDDSRALFAAIASVALMACGAAMAAYRRKRR